VAIRHYAPVDESGAGRLRATTVAWAALLGELHAVGFRPYLELGHGGRDDPLRLFCELDGGLLLDVSLGDEEILDTPPAINDTDWVAFVQANDGYVARSRRGNHRLKNAMWLSAFCSLHHDRSRDYYARKRSEGKLHNAAITCLARRRCDVIHAMLQDSATAN
jgi:hypothetical protein